MKRRLSHSELSTLHSCEYQHDFRYVGHLAGTALQPKRTAIVLREGRAWGAAVAAWHAVGDLTAARAELHLSLARDAKQLEDNGFYDQGEHHLMAERLNAMLDHYVSDAIRIPLQVLEHQVLVPIPSRAGGRSSTLYELEGYLDGVATDKQGRDWIVEFKLRKQLQTTQSIAMSPQLRRYAWAWKRQTGRDVAGIIVDERLNDAPKPARILKDGKPSHAKDQHCTPEAYLQACHDTGVEANVETYESLRQRRWSERHTIFLTELDLADTGRQLVSSAQSLRELESRRRDPVRNPDPRRCPGCPFREICLDPSQHELVDALFVRVPAKRDREPVAA